MWQYILKLREKYKSDTSSPDFPDLDPALHRLPPPKCSGVPVQLQRPGALRGGTWWGGVMAKNTHPERRCGLSESRPGYSSPPELTLWPSPGVPNLRNFSVHDILSSGQSTSTHHLKTWGKVSRCRALSLGASGGWGVSHRAGTALSLNNPDLLGGSNPWGQGWGCWVESLSLPGNLGHQSCFKTQFP